MKKRMPKLKIELTFTEAKKLATHLASHVSKGSMSTTPAWARRIVGKISEAVHDLKKEVLKGEQ